MSKTQGHFGTKRRADYNAQDNAHLALSTMLGAEMREKAEKASHAERMAWFVGVVTVISLVAGIILTFVA